MVRGTFVSNDGLLDWYRLDSGNVLPTSHTYLDKQFSYLFEIDKGFIYPSNFGLIPIVK